MKHPLHNDELNESNVPDFAIFQDDNRRVTSLWSKGKGKWVQCQESEFDILQGLAEYIRTCDNPEQVMREIADQVRNSSDGK
jgi:hypothetical protein